MKKYLLIILHFTFYILHFTFVTAIEVGGHLTENTVWSPDNNPYEITTVLYVDEGVILTIHPGTEIKIKSAPLASHQDANNYFWFSGSGEPEAKMIWVKGQIIAEGTVDNIISFTRLYDEPNHCWGVIYVDYMANTSIFDYCSFNFSGFTGIAVGNYNGATLTLCNPTSKITNCFFGGGQEAVCTKEYQESFLFYRNVVDYSNCIVPFLDCLGVGVSGQEGFNNVLVAENHFKNVNNDTFRNVHLVNNYFYNCNEHTFFSGYYFNNERKYCEFGLDVDGGGGSVYMKSNRFIGGYNGVNIEHAYVEFSDNYMENCSFQFYANNQSKIFNNSFNNATLRSVGSNHGFYNNTIYNNNNTSWDYAFASTYDKNVNNLFLNNQTLFNTVNDTTFINCIFINNSELYNRPDDDKTDTFINCIMDFPIGESQVDGGGNIIVDSTQVEQIFVDLVNEDFHLTPGSIAIDAGCDTIDYYYPFDMDYAHRIWDGDGDGNAVIDIGPYEYGSPNYGGIRGTTYNPDSEYPINYVLLKINDIAGEFTFSDSIGNFEYKLQEGVYDVYAERLYYDDVIMYEVEVIEGEFTDISIPMFATTEAEENGIITPSNSFKLRNYPNPFNPETTIEFLITEDNRISLSIYNIRGQLVKTLINSTIEKGKHHIIWNGKNEFGFEVSSGIYYCKLKNGNQESVRKMILIK